MTQFLILSSRAIHPLTHKHTLTYTHVEIETHRCIRIPVAENPFLFSPQPQLFPSTLILLPLIIRNSFLSEKEKTEGNSVSQMHVLCYEGRGFLFVPLPSSSPHAAASVPTSRSRRRYTLPTVESSFPLTAFNSRTEVLKGEEKRNNIICDSCAKIIYYHFIIMIIEDVISANVSPSSLNGDC
jgi:hypothetical protein